jgi:hypothetical protein
MVFRVVYSKRQRYPMARKTTLDREVHVCLAILSALGGTNDRPESGLLREDPNAIISNTHTLILYSADTLRKCAHSQWADLTGIQYSILTIFSARSDLHN